MTMLKTHPIDPSLFDDEVFNFISDREGTVRRIYTDSEGIPTLGVGYAFLID